MEPIIKVDNVSMCFNLSREKHESLKEYLLALVQGRLQYDEFYLQISAKALVAFPNKNKSSKNKTKKQRGK